MHAIGGNYNEYYNKLIEMGQRDGFAVCVPFGMPSTDSQKRTGQWNCHYEYQSSDTIDDVGFVNELAKFLQKKYKLNPLNTFCTGHSTGGDFCFIMQYNVDSDSFNLLDNKGKLPDRIVKPEYVENIIHPDDSQTIKDFIRRIKTHVLFFQLAVYNSKFSIVFIHNLYVKAILTINRINEMR